MQSAVADGAANRVLQQLAQRAMRNDLQSAQNMQTALEAMGLLEAVSYTHLTLPTKA